MRFFYFILIAIAIVGCANSYQRFYKPIADHQTLSDVELLKPNETPKIYRTDDMIRDIEIFLSKMYVPLGESSFNGGIESEVNAIEQAKLIGATVVLINSKYTNTENSTIPLLLPNTATTYNSGTVHSGGSYGSYSGTSTTVGSRVVPITQNVRRYDQSAVFFVKSTKQPKFGIHFVDLSPEDRAAIERNTGVLIRVVIESSPAFFSNILPGDILIKINDTDIINVKQAKEAMAAFDTPAKCIFTVIRKGQEQVIPIKFSKAKQ